MDMFNVTMIDKSINRYNLGNITQISFWPYFMSHDHWWKWKGRKQRRELYESDRRDHWVRQEWGMVMSIGPRWFLEIHDFHDTFISKEGLS